VLGARQHGREATGPHLTACATPGPTHYLLADGHGVLLVVPLMAANRHGSTELELLPHAVPPVKSLWGPATPRWTKRHVDRDYAFDHCRAACHRRGFDSRERLGGHRRLAGAGPLAGECPLAWLVRFRRVAIRYDRRVDLRLVFTTLACTLIGWHRLQERFCQALLASVVLSRLLGQRY
jgi:hypothetical protein